MNADVVWQILSNSSDYKEQQRFSAVCKEWSLICKWLPKLSITISPAKREQGQEILGKALNGRCNLRELEVCVQSMIENPCRPLFMEQDFFNALQQVWASIEKLTLGVFLFKELTESGWIRIKAGFPNLLHLHISIVSITAGPGGLIFPNFTKLTLHSKVSGAVLSEIFTSCSSLEDCTANSVEGPVHVKSSSLVNLELRNKSMLRPVHEARIEACKLRTLELWNLNLSVELGLDNLRCLQLTICRKGMRLPPLPSLKLFILYFPSFSEFLELPFRESLTHLIIYQPIKVPRATLTLQQLVPQQLEFLYFQQARKDMYMVADEMFRKKTDTEIRELLHAQADDLPCFPCLKQVVVRFSRLHKITTNQGVLDLLSVVVQFLRCSSRLEHLFLDVTDYLHQMPLELAKFAELDARVHLESPPAKDYLDFKTYSKVLAP